jgi:hypothetical protein
MERDSESKRDFEKGGQDIRGKREGERARENSHTERDTDGETATQMERAGTVPPLKERVVVRRAKARWINHAMALGRATSATDTTSPSLPDTTQNVRSTQPHDHSNTQPQPRAQRTSTRILTHTHSSLAQLSSAQLSSALTVDGESSCQAGCVSVVASSAV